MEEHYAIVLESGAFVGKGTRVGRKKAIISVSHNPKCMKIFTDRQDAEALIEHFRFKATVLKVN
jgi:hypothetical protein